MSEVEMKNFGNTLNKINITVKNQIFFESTIEKVIVDSKNSNMNIFLNSLDIIDYKEISNIENVLSKELKEFKKINIIIKYSIDKKDIKKLVKNNWDNIIFLIKTKIPSSLAWIENITWQLNENIVTINLPSEIALVSIVKKELDICIQEKMKREFNVNFKIKFEVIKQELGNASEYIIKRKQEELDYINSLESINNSNINTKITERKKENETNNKLIYGKKIGNETMKISEIDTHTATAIIQGEIFNVNIRDIKGDKKLYTLEVTDFSSSIIVKFFANKKSQVELDEKLKKGLYIRAEGNVMFDTFARQLIIMGKALRILEKPMRLDKHEEKRVELHVHTKMSAMDGLSNFTNIAERAANWGHKAIAITDHGIVQSFPEGMAVAKKYGIKILYGLEGYLVNDSKIIVRNYRQQEIDCEYVVFDIETTGFSPINDKITEIGAVKIKNNVVIERYNQLINPGIPIPENIVKITGITDELVSDKPKIEDILPEFQKFMGNSVLVAHNSPFDMGFIKEKFNKIEINITNTSLDTLELSRCLFPTLKRHKLNLVAKHLDIKLENHHRAVDDAEATSKIFMKCIEIMKDKGIGKLEEINTTLGKNGDIKTERPYHIVIFAKNYIGLKNLYKIVSESHMNYFYRKPRIPKSLLAKYRDGLIFGSACEAGELFKAILKNADFNEVREIVNFYDYLEIQPVENNLHLVRNGNVKNLDELRMINKKIVNLGEKFNKPVVATGDVHFLDPQDEIYRRILMSGQGFTDADNQPPLYLKTTDEMLEEFNYLGKEKSEEIVIKNTNMIADMIEEILPIPDGTFPPIIEGSEEELKKMTYDKAIKIYGDNIPDIVKARLDKELNSIISNGYAVLYMIAHKLVKKSLEDGYLVGSRGSVGSSFVATMSDITEVNPLPPHYICPVCKKSEFITDGSVGSGVDMKDKTCPNCGNLFEKDGFDIPFEVFLGFEGDKEPDIDLNFAGVYQSTAHKYTEELFGEGYVFRAGTIGTIAEKTAYGFVRKYFDGKDQIINNTEINRLVQGCTGVKRTSGQHPGGVMVVPNYKDVYDFTPIQYPANDKTSGVITTHFDYHSISGRILKLDILGHDTPSIIRMLEDFTAVNAQDIPLDDKETMKIFTSTESLGITKEDINSQTGSFGIPEFGTNFVRQMLIDTQPTTFAELVRISGLSHGTDVWLNNAQDLVRNGTTKLNKVISTRDDIMMYLIYSGLDKKKSFTIMEKVRKGKGLTEEDEAYMKKHNVPSWYIESCKKIKYMFPKAHAVAYVMMSFRIAYFKVHYPKAFYATYFTTKVADFDAELMVRGIDIVKGEILKVEAKGKDKTTKEKGFLTVLEVVLEMYARGFKLQKVDLYKSHNDKFLLNNEGILPPLRALQGVGENAARNILQERVNGKFLSIEDLTNRAKVTKTVIEALKIHGCLDGMSQSNQLSFLNI